ncbi:unnamed protein product [Ascophyllum nodosum]
MSHKLLKKEADKMAHDTSASVRVRYLPVSGDDVTRGAPSDGMDHIITVGGQRKWWWQSGPVDSCCFCFPLEVGIVILAGMDVAASSFLLWMFELVKDMMNTAATNLELIMEREKYENSCSGDSPTMTENECQLLEQQLKFLQSGLNVYQHPPAIFYVYEYIMYIILLVGLAGGVAGLVAGCGSNTLAAKLFFWSCLPGLFLRTASLTVWFVTGQIGSISIVFWVLNAVYYFFAIYFAKVSWSYYAVLKARDVNTSPGVGSAVELRGISDGDWRSGATV